MVLYNTLIGVTAGMALVLVPVLARRVHRGDPIAPAGWAMTFGVLGVVMTFLSATMVTTWPLTAKPQVNILFGEPTLLLGVLLVAASVFLWRRGEVLESAGAGAPQELHAVLSPVSWVVFALGLILAACTVAIFRFTAIGAAPSQEPIMGRFSEHPGVENTLVGLIYAFSALGTLLAPAAARDLGGAPARMAGWCMTVAGVVLTAYSAMNYYTHVGLEVRTG
jgi:hypothetical protein